MAEEFQTILVSVENNIGRIILNRPKELNAISSQLMAETTVALKRLEQDPAVRCIVLSAEGRAFSAGFDLKESAIKVCSTTPQWRANIEADFEFIMQFWTCKKPTIAAVHGYCLAGGLELAVACDMTVAGEEAIFGEPEVRFGSGIVALIVPWIVGPKISLTRMRVSPGPLMAGIPPRSSASR